MKRKKSQVLILEHKLTQWIAKSFNTVTITTRELLNPRRAEWPRFGVPQKEFPLFVVVVEQFGHSSRWNLCGMRYSPTAVIIYIFFLKHHWYYSPPPQVKYTNTTKEKVSSERIRLVWFVATLKCYFPNTLPAGLQRSSGQNRGGGGVGGTTLDFYWLFLFLVEWVRTAGGGGVKQITIRGKEENDATERHRGTKRRKKNHR